MIGSLRGRVADVDPEGELLVDVAGVGYRVAVSPATLVAAGDVDGEVELWVSQAVRDDVPRLFGFLTRDERVCFEQLLGAHGVGPALALAVLSHLSPDDLRRAVLADDHKALTLVPGVGQRTAQRMLIDLKAKLGLPTAVALVGAPASGGAAAEVRAALEAMDFSPGEVRTALAGLGDRTVDPDADAAELVRLALQSLNRQPVA